VTVVRRSATDEDALESSALEDLEEEVGVDPLGIP
jgi:hypothetical protein